MTVSQGNSFIKNPTTHIIPHFDKGNTAQIMRVIMKVVNKDELQQQVNEFAAQLLLQNRGDKLHTLHALWKIVKKDIRYIPDGFGIQAIKHPARTWHDGYGDCKSMTVFIYFVCRALDIPCYITFTSYAEDKEIGHVYPIAIIGDRQVIVDAVYDTFDAEPEYTDSKDRFSKVYTKAKIKAKMTQIVEIAGLKNMDGYSRDELQDMSMSLQQKGKLSLPKSPFYGLTTESEGVILAQLKAEKFNKLGLIARARGDMDGYNANLYMRDQLINLGQKTVHQHGANMVRTQGLDNLGALQLKKFAAHIQRLNVRASSSGEVQLRNRIKGQGIYGPYDQYEPVGQEVESCRSLATTRDTDIFGNIDYEGGWNFNESVFETCKTGKYMEKVVNAHMKKAGSTYLYHMMPSNNLYYSSISSKRLRQQEWAFDISQATGLSVAVIEGFFDNGIIETLEYDANDAYILFHPAMTIGQNQIGIAPAVIAAIIAGVVALTGSIAQAVVQNNAIKAAAQAKKEGAFNTVQGMNPLLYAPGQNDFDTNFGSGSSSGGNNNGGNNNNGGSGSSNLPLIIGAGIAAAVLLK